MYSVLDNDATRSFVNILFDLVLFSVLGLFLDI